MPSPEDDIVLTGFGVVSPIGVGAEAFWKSLLDQQGGVVLTEPTDAVNGRRWMSGLINHFEPKSYVQPRKSLKVMCIESQIAFAASVMACRQAGIEPGSVQPDRIGTVFGSEMLFSENEDIRSIVQLCRDGSEMKHQRWGANAMEHMYPLWMLKSLPNMPACHVGIWLDARGPNNTLTSDETSGLTSLIDAAHVIRRGQADCMLVGASGSKTSLTRLLQRDEANYSTSYEKPEAACKPFDRHRDGTVSGSGAGVIVLERRSHADARGAKPIARLLSWSSTFGRPERSWGGSSDAVARSISQSLERANIDAQQIDHVNASAKGMIDLDASEAQGIAKSVGDVPVMAIKGFVGDAGAGAGVMELCASLAGIADRLVPATLNHQQASADCPIQVIHGQPKAWTKPCFIKTSLTPYGQAASVLFSVEA
ncbi:MAG: beta-ketoacyl synthase N-terminal-like domain-containing protein [Pirellulaceae bacterium]|nr:beta-ketoacyl synthase N-terminal-like domain-containing protein [Pirellulaceae bacterium]